MNQIAAGAQRLGVVIADQALGRLIRYRDLLLEANTRFNLTSLESAGDIDRRLIVASLALLPLVPDRAVRLIDLGSGGGIPGLVIAICRPDVAVVLLDATAKKVRFLSETAAALHLGNVAAVHGRAEELGAARAHRERYDVVTARAVARLATLVELALPFLKIGGLAILPKGSAAGDELREARYAIGLLGGRARPPATSLVEGTTVIVVDKRRPTPATFPRRAGVPNKTPLLG